MTVGVILYMNMTMQEALHQIGGMVIQMEESIFKMVSHYQQELISISLILMMG